MVRSPDEGGARGLKRFHRLDRGGRRYQGRDMYRVVQLDFTLEIEVLKMLFLTDV